MPKNQKKLGKKVKKLGKKVSFPHSVDAFTDAYAEPFGTFVSFRYTFDADQTEQVCEMYQTELFPGPKKKASRPVGKEDIRDHVFPIVKKFWEEQVNTVRWSPPKPAVRNRPSHTRSLVLSGDENATFGMDQSVKNFGKDGGNLNRPAEK